jgi:hypothetical protein
MTDKRIEKNQANVLKLRDFLLEICSNFKDYFDNEEILNALASQGNLAKYENKELEIIPSSLNTLKKTSEKLFSTGFEELDKLRLLALNKLTSSVENSVGRNTKDYYQERCKKLEEELAQQQQINLLAIHELMNDIQLLKNIQNVNETKLIHSLCEKNIKRLQSYALNFAEFTPLKKESHLALVKGKKDE